MFGGSVGSLQMEGMLSQFDRTKLKAHDYRHRQNLSDGVFSW